MTEAKNKTDWQRIAKRIRVPLGFAFAAVYMWLAHPTWSSVALGAAIAALGVWIRGYASGYVKKNEELTTTGPYAHTRNPLYLGSVIIAVGFAIAARNWIIGVVLVLMYLLIYVPVIRGEEQFLRSKFANFDEYCSQVPRLLPRITAARVGNSQAGSFSRELYLKHREYNALIGALAVVAALAGKILWVSR